MGIRGFRASAPIGGIAKRRVPARRNSMCKAAAAGVPAVTCGPGPASLNAGTEPAGPTRNQQQDASGHHLVSRHRVATLDPGHLAGGMACVISGQQRCDTGDLGRSAGATDGGVATRDDFRL